METHQKITKSDRRAMRSKRLIMEAWRELVLEKEYKKITVSDIVERADIGRATFYAHFEDKDDLGRYMFQQLLSQVEAQIQEILDENSSGNELGQQLVPSLALFRIAEEKYPWFKRNATNPRTGLVMFVKPLGQRLKRELDAMDLPPRSDDISTEIIAQFLVSGLISLVTDWVMNDMPSPPEEMDRIYQSLAAPSIERLLGTSS